MITVTAGSIQERGGGVGPKCADQHRAIRDRQAANTDRRFEMTHATFVSVY